MHRISASLALSLALAGAACDDEGSRTADGDADAQTDVGHEDDAWQDVPFDGDDDAQDGTEDGTDATGVLACELADRTFLSTERIKKPTCPAFPGSGVNIASILCPGSKVTFSGSTISMTHSLNSISNRKTGNGLDHS